MELGEDVKQRLYKASNWVSVLEELEREADALDDEAAKSEKFFELGVLCEELIPERDRALAAYQRAWKIFPANLKALACARGLYEELGRTEMVARLGEIELKSTDDAGARAKLATAVGEALLDIGQPDKAAELLASALQATQDSERVQDALAAAQYDKSSWEAEVERLRVESDDQPSSTAARMCLRAARILRMEKPDDPVFEEMLRRVLSFDAQNSNANRMLEALLAESERWDELSVHHEQRAYAAPDDADQAFLYRRFAFGWMQRFKDKERAAGFFQKALAASYENGGHLPSEIAALSVVKESFGEKKEWDQFLGLADRALASSAGGESRVFTAALAGQVAWKELGDTERARDYLSHLSGIAEEHPILVEYVGEFGAVSAPTNGAGPQDIPIDVAAKPVAAKPVAAKPVAAKPVAAKPVAAKPVAAKRKPKPKPKPTPPPTVEIGPEEIEGEQQKLIEKAQQAESKGPDRAIDAWKKAIRADPSKRGPRRELARVVREAERWTALIEALKEEESLACRTDEEKAGVLLEMVQVYGDHLSLAVMVANTLKQVHKLQPNNLEVIDRLSLDFESTKKWPDLIGVLKKKAELLADPDEQVAVYLQVANLYVERFSNQAEAIKAYEAVLEVNPDNGEATSQLKGFYEKRRDWEKLIALSRREIAHIEDPGGRLQKTIELAKLSSEKLRKPAVAIDAWEDVLGLDDHNAEALAQLEKLYEREENWERLGDVCSRLADLAEGSQKAQSLQKLGILYTDKLQDPDKAIDAWRRLLDADPNHRRAQDSLKKVYLAAKNWDELENFYSSRGKIDEYVRVLERQADTEEPGTQVEILTKVAGMYRDQLNKPDRAARAFEKILTIDEHHLEAAEALIPLYEGGRDQTKLIGVLEAQLEHTTDASDRVERIKRLAGLCEEKLGDSGAAFGWWLKAFQVDPEADWIRTEVERMAKEVRGWDLLVENYEGAYEKLGDAASLPLRVVVARVLEAELGEHDRALEASRKVLELDSGNEDAIDSLARLYLGRQQFDELLDIYEKKLESTMDGDARLVLRRKIAQLFEEEINDDDRAIEAYRGILDESGEEPETLAALGRIYERKEQWSDVAEILQRELGHVGPDDDRDRHLSIKYRIGQVREKRMDDVAGAIECYRDILELSPEHPNARAALEAHLQNADHQMAAATLLGPIYEALEAWPELVAVYEIELLHAEFPDRKAELLLRVGDIAAQHLGDSERAFSAYARCVEANPSSDQARQQLEQIAALFDDGLPRLIGIYETALASGDLDPRLQYEMAYKAAVAYDQSLDNADKAAELYRQALAVEPEDAKVLDALETIFTRSERYEELVEISRKKAELAEDPEKRVALQFRVASIFEEMLQNPDEAITAYREVVSQDAENRRAFSALDRLYQAQEQWQDLADNLTRQLSLCETPHEQVELLMRLGQLRQTHLSEMAAAVDTYRQVLELAGDHQGAVEALESLLGEEEHELTIAQTLEPIYEALGESQKQVRIYEIMAKHAFDPARKIELLHKVGEMHEIAGEDMNSAFSAYARALREDPSSEMTLERLHRLARVSGSWDGIVALYDEVIGDLSDDDLKVGLLEKLAQVHELELQDDAQAVSTYDRLLEIDGSNVAAATSIQNIHERNANYPELVSALLKKADAIYDVPEKKALLFRAAQIEEEIVGNAEAAIVVYQKVLQTDEMDAQALEALERLLVRLERWDELKDVYIKKADLAQDPQQKKQMLYVLGQVYDRESSDVPRAIEVYQQILDLDPDDLNAIQALDRLYGQAERWYDLLQILEREVEVSDSVDEIVAVKYRIGQLWELELKDLTRSVESYKEAIEMDAMHEPTLAALHRIVQGDGEPVLAAQVLLPLYENAAEFEKLVELYEVMAKHAEDPFRQVELLHQIANIYEYRLEQHEAAFAAYGRALAIEPSNEQTLGHLDRLADLTRAWEPLSALYEEELQKTSDAARQVDLMLRLARIYEEELANVEQAITTHQRVLDVESENRAAVMALDRLYSQAERWSDLAEVLRKEARLTENDEEAIAVEFRLGQVYEQALRDIPSAAEVYREILTKDPNHSSTLNALEMLLAEGNYQLEIAGILEPIYRGHAEWDKLHAILEVQFQSLKDPADRVSALTRLAEMAEENLLDAERAFLWWGAAYREDPQSEKPADEAERLAEQIGTWSELADVYAQTASQDLDPDVQKRVFLRLARVCNEKLQDPGRAEEAYLRVLTIDGRDVDALRAMDRIYEIGGMHAELAEILKSRVEVTDAPGELTELYMRLGAIQCETLGDYDAAEKAFTSVLEHDSGHRQAMDSLERVFVLKEEWEKLYQCYEQMVDISEDDDERAEAYARMAKISSDALDDEERAIDMWSRVLDMRGDDPKAYGAMADLYERREMWNDLVEIVGRQVQATVEPVDRVAQYKRLGKVWAEKLDRERNALDAWLQAYEIEPQDLETLHALAHLYRATQAWEELSDTIQKILEAGQLHDSLSEEDMVDWYSQLGQLEGEVLGRTNEAVEAWRRVLALKPDHFDALGALENLFTREARWEDCIEVLEKRAIVLEDPAQSIETLLQAGAIWDEKVGDKSSAAQVYERVRSVEPQNALASSQLEAIYREQCNWEKLIEIYLERVEFTDEPLQRIDALQNAAKIYEEELGDQDSAFVILQAAFKEDFSYEPVTNELERLATAANKWEELLGEYSQVVAGLESEAPDKAADLWVKIGRWYGDHLSHVDYAIHSVQSALRLDENHLGALDALADFQRKRGAWGELIETLGKHAALEEDVEKKVELQLALGELWETQLMDQQQAMAAYRAAVDVDANCPAALSALDRLYRANELWEPLITVLTQKADALEEPDEQVAVLLEIGRLWDEQLNEPSEAIGIFNLVLDIDDNSLPALRALESLYEKTGEGEKYLDVLERQQDASENEADQIALYERMAAAWEERFGKLHRAAESLEKILAIDDRNYDTYRELERIYRQEQKADSLVDTYRRHVEAVSDPSTRIELCCAMGQVYEDDLNDLDRAIEAYSEVLNYDAQDPRALDALGRLYEKTQQWDKAIDTMTQLVDATEDPGLRVELLHRIGRILDQQLSDPDGAEKRFLQALAMNDAHVPTMESITELYKGRGDWHKAANMMVEAERHSEIAVDKVRLLTEAAEIYQGHLNDTEHAIEFFSSALAIDPEHVEAGEPLAELYFAAQRWADLEPLLDMIVRKSAQDRRSSEEMHHLYFRSATCAAELGNSQKALENYKAAYDIDSRHLPTLMGRAAVLYQTQDWDGAGKIYQTILVQHRDSLQPENVVDVYYRLGEVRLALGERRKALNMFEKSLEIDATHRDTLLAVIDLQSQQGDFGAVIHAKRSLLQSADADEQFNILDQIGDVYHQQMENAQKAIATYHEALEIKEGNHAVLQKVLDLYSETKQWKKAVEIMVRFGEIETNNLVKATYYYAAGVTSRDEVKSLDEAVTYFDLALDNFFHDKEPLSPEQASKHLKAFEATDKILTQKKDWKQLERSYRKQIKRMPQTPGDKVLAMLWHNLGEIYRSRLNDFKAAVQAFDVATHLDPDNKHRREILAELYVMSGPEYADKAVEQHSAMIKEDPFKIDSYKALRKIYMDTHQYDKSWCVCNALYFMQKADAEEKQFYEQYRPQGFVRAKQRLGDAEWRKLFHPNQDLYVSAIFGAIWQGAALAHARPHKAFGLKRKDRRPVESDQLMFSKVMYYASQVMNIPMPEVYLQPDQPGELLIANTEDRGTIVPSIVVRQNILQGRTEKDVAFLSAQQLSYMRPEHYLAKALTTNTERRTAFMSALVMVQPAFPLKPDQVPLVQRYLPLLQKHMAPQWVEQLQKVVKKFLQGGGETDLNKWKAAVDSTAHRVGFLLSGDLETAARVVSMEPVDVGAPDAKDKVRELVLFSISEEFFALRKHLGMVVA